MTLIKLLSKEYKKREDNRRMLLSEPRYQKVLSLIKDKHFHRSLDVGCFGGDFAKRLLPYSDSVYGVDIVRKSVERAKKLKIKAFCVDLEKDSLPFPNNFFDFVHFGETIEHLVNTDHVLEEIYRVLEPKGIVIITTPNLCWWVNRLVMLFGYQPFGTEVSLRYSPGKLYHRWGEQPSSHVRLFSPPALIQLCKKYKLIPQKIEICKPTPPLPLPFNLIDSLLSLKKHLVIN